MSYTHIISVLTVNSQTEAKYANYGSCKIRIWGILRQNCFCHKPKKIGLGSKNSRILYQRTVMPIFATSVTNLSLSKQQQRIDQL